MSINNWTGLAGRAVKWVFKSANTLANCKNSETSDAAEMPALGRWIGRAVLAGVLISPAASALADGGNPFELTNTVATSWQGYLKTVVITIAGLAGTVVILMAMFGVLRLRWAVQIIGGLIALSGLTWLIASVQGNG